MASANRPIHDISRLADKCRQVIEQAEKDASANPGAKIAPDFNKVFSCDFDKGRSAANCVWFNIFAEDDTGMRAPFSFKTGKLRLAGGIHPSTKEGLAAINAARAKNGYPLLQKERDQPPALIFSKYETSPETLPDNDTALDESKPLPPMTDLGLVMDCFNRWFLTTLLSMVKSGKIVGPPQVGEDEPAPDALRMPSTKVCPAMQTHFSMKHKKAPGKPMPNPQVRFNIKCDKETGVLKNCVLYDGKKPAGKGFELLSDQKGVAFNDSNAHECIKNGADIMMFAKVDSVCCSNLGISAPRSITLAVVYNPETTSRTITLEELMGTDPAPSAAAPSAAAPSAPVPVTPAPVTPAPSAAAAFSSHDVEAMLSSVADNI